MRCSRSFSSFCFVLIAVLGLPSLGAAQLLGKDQVNCVKRMNQRASGVALQVGRQYQGCVRQLSALDPGEEQTFEQCRSENSNAIGAAVSATESAQVTHCGDPVPPYGYALASEVNAAAVGESVLLEFDLLAADLGAADPVGESVLSSDLDPVGARCQQSVQKSWGGVVRRVLGEFSTCKKKGLAKGAITSEEELTECFDVVETDQRGKLEKAVSKVERTIDKRCEGVSLADAFPGVCAAAPSFQECVAERVRCRMCRLLNGADALNHDCDDFDNETADGSCPTE